MKIVQRALDHLKAIASHARPIRHQQTEYVINLQSATPAASLVQALMRPSARPAKATSKRSVGNVPVPMASTTTAITPTSNAPTATQTALPVMALPYINA